MNKWFKFRLRTKNAENWPLIVVNEALRYFPIKHKRNFLSWIQPKTSPVDKMISLPCRRKRARRGCRGIRQACQRELEPRRAPGWSRRRGGRLRLRAGRGSAACATGPARRPSRPRRSRLCILTHREEPLRTDLQIRLPMDLQTREPCSLIKVPALHRFIPVLRTRVKREGRIYVSFPDKPNNSSVMENFQWAIGRLITKYTFLFLAFYDCIFFSPSVIQLMLNLSPGKEQF